MFKVKSEFLKDRWVAWKNLPGFYLLMGLFLLLFGLFSGLFLAALYRPDTPALSGPENEILPVGIRILSEPERKTLSEIQVDPLRTPDTVTGADETSVAPKEATKPVPETAEDEVSSKADSDPRESAHMAEQGLKKNPQKEKVDEQGVEKILKTGEFRIYTTTKEDTLWRIAEKCYGSGYYFPVLMECNPSLNIYDMEAGTKVRILKDDRLVQRLYHKITRMVGNELFFYYRVIEGDTFESIAERFYNRKEPAKRIEDLNPHSALLPGSRIKIALE